MYRPQRTPYLGIAGRSQPTGTSGLDVLVKIGAQRLEKQNVYQTVSNFR
jgi:hypothetical protein